MGISVHVLALSTEEHVNILDNMDVLKLAEQVGFGMIYRRNENGDMVLHSCAEVDMVKLQALLDKQNPAGHVAIKSNKAPSACTVTTFA